MAGTETVREIVVRTITGESTTVKLSGDSTVEDLKLLLSHNFPPASLSPNFHLFFKGVKLRLQSRIGMQSIRDGEFIVLVPFTKKNSNQTQKSDRSKTSTNVTNENSISKFADSAWSEIMQDLSNLRDSASTGDSNTERCSFSHGDRGEEMAGAVCSGFSTVKRKRGNDYDDLILDILSSPESENVLDEKHCERLVKVLGLISCLSDPLSGDCLYSRRVGLLGFGVNGKGLQKNCGSSCLCPAWLKAILKAFAFLNIVYALLQLRRERISLTLLEEMMDQLGKFGVNLDMKDLEHLSALSPKVVCFANDAEDQTSCTGAIIINCSTQQKVQVKENSKFACRGMDVSEIFCSLKQRECSLRTTLWEAVQCFMFAEGNGKVAFLSLEELLLSVKNCGSAATSNRKERKKARSSASSSSHSDPKRCHVGLDSQICKGTNKLTPLEMVEHLKKGLGSHGQIVHVEDIGARKAVHVEIPNNLSQDMMSTLKNIGVTKLYSHQAESIEASLAGKNVVVATMTSSGKSLCYNLPVLQVLSQNMSSCALYLFPTKALAQDQLRALLFATKELDCGLNIGVYDGDTSQGDRAWLRDNARLLITNPDMLHLSILPYHKQFGRILLNLRFVVVDEAHTYKGAFGCHTAFILRRLHRLCAHVYGSDPSFVFSTATSANPREHCMDLANLPTLELIQNDGSPAAWKLFILWNPVVDRENVSKKRHGGKDASEYADKFRSTSPILDVSLLFAEMVQHGLRCIAFCKTRKLCELVLSYT